MSKTFSLSAYEGNNGMKNNFPLTRVAKFQPTNGNTPNKNGGLYGQSVQNNSCQELRGMSQEHGTFN